MDHPSLHAIVKFFEIKATKKQILTFVATCHPEWSNTRLAKVCGITRTYLSKPEIASLLERIRNLAKPAMINGHHTTNGIEAVTDEEDDE